MHKTYTTYTTRRLSKLSLKLFLTDSTRNQHASGSFVHRTHRPCVMCVDARRYGCTAEMLAYTTHEQRYLGSNPRAWLEGGLHHKSNSAGMSTLLPTPSNQNCLLCLLSTMYAYYVCTLHHGSPSISKSQASTESDRQL